MPPVPRPPPPLPGHVRTPARQREGAVGAQPVMVVEVLVARRQGQHPLRHQRLQAMLDPPRVVVAEARRQPRRHPEAPVDLPQQQHAAVRRQPAAVEPAHHRPPAKAFKRQLRRGTLCAHGAAPSWPVGGCLSYLYHAFPLHAPPAGEISGLGPIALTHVRNTGCRVVRLSGSRRNAARRGQHLMGARYVDGGSDR